MNYQIGVIGSSERRGAGRREAKALGMEIAKAGCQLLTGGCTGLPDAAAEGAKEKDGLTIGVSPASNREEHLEGYQYPVENYDVMIYTGFGFKGRTTILVRSCDGVIAVSGKIGTLNELTIAYAEKKVIGLLEEVPGAAAEFGDLLEKLDLSPKKVVSSPDPAELVKRVIGKLEKGSELG